MERKDNAIFVSGGEFKDFLMDIMSEVLDKGIEYDDEAKKVFKTEKEFEPVQLEFKMYGMLFGRLYIQKLLEKIREFGEKAKEGNK